MLKSILPIAVTLSLVAATGCFNRLPSEPRMVASTIEHQYIDLSGGQTAPVGYGKLSLTVNLSTAGRRVQATIGQKAVVVVTRPGGGYVTDANGNHAVYATDVGSNGMATIVLPPLPQTTIGVNEALSSNAYVVTTLIGNWLNATLDTTTPGTTFPSATGYSLLAGVGGFRDYANVASSVVTMQLGNDVQSAGSPALANYLIASGMGRADVSPGLRASADITAFTHATHIFRNSPMGADFNPAGGATTTRTVTVSGYLDTDPVTVTIGGTAVNYTVDTDDIDEDGIATALAAAINGSAAASAKVSASAAGPVVTLTPKITGDTTLAVTDGVTVDLTASGTPITGGSFQAATNAIYNTITSDSNGQILYRHPGLTASAIDPLTIAFGGFAANKNVMRVVLSLPSGAFTTAPSVAIGEYDPESATSSVLASSSEFNTSVTSGSNPAFTAAASNRLVWKDFDMSSLSADGDAIDFNFTGLPALSTVKIWTIPLGTKWIVTGDYTANTFQ